MAEVSDVERSYDAGFDAVVDGSPNIERVTGPVTYWQRPDQAIVHRRTLPQLMITLDRLDITLRNHDDVHDVASETFPAPDIELVQLQRPGGEQPTTEELLLAVNRDLRTRDTGAVVAPHYVFSGAGNIMGHPDGPPVAASQPATIEVVASSDLFTTDYRVGICDTGICAPGVHDDVFGGRYTDGPDVRDPVYVTGSTDALRLESAHGTFVAGVLAQKARGATFVPDVALDDDGFGDELMVASALRRLDRAGVRIINLSLGAPALAGGPLGLAAAIAALSPDAVVLAAAGNTGTDALHYPAALPGVIAVGATEIVDDVTVVAPYSNTGRWIKVWAPGTATSAFVRGTLTVPGMAPVVLSQPWATWSGTSFATPFVAGWIAQQASATGAQPRRVAGDLLIDPPDTLLGAALLV